MSGLGRRVDRPIGRIDRYGTGPWSRRVSGGEYPFSCLFLRVDEIRGKCRTLSRRLWARIYIAMRRDVILWHRKN
jgi:hypothetical protein